jgi:hypothetical protein
MAAFTSSNEGRRSEIQVVDEADGGDSAQEQVETP